MKMTFDSQSSKTLPVNSQSVGFSPGLLYFSQPHQSTSSSSTLPDYSSSNPSHPPFKPAPNPFSCLNSLRALEKNLTQPNSFDDIYQQNSDWSTGLNRFIVRCPLDTLSQSNSIDSNKIFAEEELCWKGSKLIWSKGGAIYRTFEYSSSSQASSPSSSRQHVIQALFAHFNPSSFPTPSTSSVRAPNDHTPIQCSHDNPLNPNQFGISQNLDGASCFDTSPDQPWSDNRLTQRSEQQKRWRLSESPVRALCVLLSEALKIYFDSGEEYTLAIPFHIQAIWPIEWGVMLMKKPTSIRPRPFVPVQQPPSVPTNPPPIVPPNQFKPKNMSKRSILGDSWRLPSTTQTGPTSESFMFDSMITENETRLWSSLAGFNLDDRRIEDDEDEADEQEISAELARYWQERKQIESSMLWTLSDPCAHYIQPVLTTEMLLLPNLTTESTSPKRLSAHPKFCSAFAPLTPLVTPPRRPGCGLSSGTVVFVADFKMNPLHPICITASTQGFTILAYGRLPSNFSTTSGLISPFEPSPHANIPEPDVIQQEPPANLPRSPTPPSHPPATEEFTLRRSPRKNGAPQIHPPLEPPKTSRQATKIDSQKLSPTFSRSRLPARLGGLGHPSLRRSLNQPPGNPTSSISIKKRGITAASATNSNAPGRRGSAISNVGNVSFAFGATTGQSTSIHGANGMNKSSTRKSLAEQQLEMMSGAPSGTRITSNSDKLGHPIGLDREAGGGFEDWFDGMMDTEPSDQKIDCHLADEALEPEFVIQTLETIEVPGRLTAEELPPIHATLYDSRGLTAYLAVCIPSKSTVYVFRITRTSNSISIKSVGKPWEGNAIGSVLCSRPNVYDFFKFSNSTGRIEIFSADSIFLHQFTHPDTVCSPERSVKSSFGSYVEFLSPRQATRRSPSHIPVCIRLDLKMWPLNSLVRKVIQVLSEEIGNKVVCNIFQHYIKHISAGKSPVQCLGEVLHEAVLGEEPQRMTKTGKEPSNSNVDLVTVVSQLSRLTSDPVLSQLLSMRRLEQTHQHNQIRRPPFKAPHSPKKRRTQHETSRSLSLNPELKIKVMVGLSRLYADLKLSVSCTEQHVVLGKILFQLSSCLGWINWTDKLKRSLNAIIHDTVGFSASCVTKLDEPRMPDLYDHLDRISLGTLSPYSEFFEEIFDNGDPAPLHRRQNLGFYGGQQSCRKSKQICSLYRVLNKPNQTPLEAAKNVLIKIDQFGWGLDDLDDLWFGISVPLREALRYCQYRSPHGLSARCYQLMGRPDLCMLTNHVSAQDLKQDNNHSRPASRSNSNFHIITRPPPSIQQLCTMALPMENPVFPPTELDFHYLEDNSFDAGVAARFSDDMRIIEVAEMLNYTREVKVKMHESISEMASTDVARHYSTFFVGIIRRTMSLPFGGACLWYKTDSNIAASVPMIKLDMRIVSPAIVIQPDLAKVDPLSWPRFHAGVAAGLSLSVKPEEFDSSQISLARPEELDDRHAGYLLGLGLNQHLRSINRVQIFRYLETKHEMTSIGVLLGLASAFVGTADSRVSSIIAAHVPAMHPTESIQLQVSPLTQSAGFISFGILHLGTANRRLSDGMLREMAKTWRVLTDTPDGCRESYTLCAGLGYGLVMLGTGTESDTPAHKDLMRSFKSLIQGDGAHPLPGLNQPTSTIDVSVTSPAATLALALLYLKTERSEAAMLCEIPQTPARLEYIRPDLLMIRTLARCLIMWQSIKVDMKWMESLVPPVILEVIQRAEKGHKKLKADWEMSYWAIICGALLSMALKYAGSADSAVHSMLLALYDRLLKAVSLPALNVQAKIRRSCLRSCHNVVTLGLAIVMVGTGELELLKRLRIAHGNTTDTTGYGTHVVTHLALGLLFLGGGRYTFNTSNKAVASLICAMYPIFPSRSDDHVHHLQALRHLWALAVEPRCLVARDIDRKGELIFLPLKLKVLDLPAGPHTLSKPIGVETNEPGQEAIKGLKTKLLTAPTLVPEISMIQSVKVESPRYWPFVLDLVSNPHHRSYFSKSLTLWVKRKVGHLSYSQDPKGSKSIASRGRGAERMMTCEIEDFGLRSREIRQVMKSKFNPESTKWEGQKVENLYEVVDGFDLDEQSIGLLDYVAALVPSRRDKTKVTGLTADLSSFVSTVLLQCLLEDKLEMLPTYLALFSCSKSSVPYGKRLKTQYIPDHEWQISHLIKFYGGDRSANEIELNPSNSSLLDKSLLFHIQHHHRKELISWAETTVGTELIMKYLKSNGEILLSSSKPYSSSNATTLTNENNDLHVEDILHANQLGQWLSLMNVPSPKTLNLLRSFLSQELQHLKPNPDLSQSSIRFQLIAKTLLSGQQNNGKKTTVDNYQFLDFLIQSCF